MRKQVSVQNHPLFPDQTTTARARLVMAEKLGRVLLTSEHVHHKDEDKSNDDPDNLEILPAREHHRLHKVGKKRPEVAAKLRGRKHSREAIDKMRLAAIANKEARAAAGRIGGSRKRT